MRILWRAILLAAALAAPPALCAVGFAAVVEVGSTSAPSTRDPRRCSWYCHDHSCPHPARLPAALTSDGGAFGMTIEALAVAGRVTGLGYQGMNLLVFCVLWPAVTYALFVIGACRAIGWLG
jgi:hypothetical protein